jgi:cyclopropane-fatty-acyl-phospholipid synthase
MSTLSPSELVAGSLSPESGDHAPPYQARAVLKFLERLKGGLLMVHGPGGYIQAFGDGNGPQIRITLQTWDVLTRALKHGDIGFAECYMEGLWQTDEPASLIELFCRNRDAMEAAFYGTFLGSLLYRAKHLLRGNTRARARKNISAHYDLGNDFYRLWLDRTWTYSSAWFEGGTHTTLEAAQQAKYRRILSTLNIKRGERVLEIGCGWGGFAELAAREAGARVTGLTLSTEQLEFARKRMSAAGLSDQVQLELRDYRDMAGEFDHIVSIEMFEAVGEQYWDDYFACVKRNLRAGGRAVVQSITIDEKIFPRYRTSTDFIQQYVFPGGMLPSPTEFGARAEKAGLNAQIGLRFGHDYAETLRRWRVTFMNVLPEVRSLGYDERFIRLWEFYLAYCEGAFNAASTDVIQFEIEHRA